MACSSGTPGLSAAGCFWPEVGGTTLAASLVERPMDDRRGDESEGVGAADEEVAGTVAVGFTGMSVHARI